ncbi:hypothetical protein [Paeniglutamicibacter sp. Y32M11]|uniref:hypothetical protein n=1 Tax=Paeniglutamicibacter sp. Y32M11 TaxID=2853258 RepID=UPI001C52ECD2|nr:hypothetical protein [Paeniglutamicibacter sp. Y32M11]QXQ11347.1 hypothetical protein KUF55_05490 [Paeniglutamicibacter sp. Y32M11]
MRISLFIAPLVAASLMTGAATTAWASEGLGNPDVVDSRDTTVLIEPSSGTLDGPNSSGGFYTWAVPCDGFKGSWYTTTNVKKAKTITHADMYSNFTSKSATATRQAGHETTLSAGITVTAGAAAEAGVILGKLSTSASVAIAGNGSKTSSNSIGISATINPGKYLVVAAGNVKVTGNWTKNVCSSGSAGVVAGAKGTSRSYTIRETTAVECGLKTPAGSLANLASTRYC